MGLSIGISRENAFGFKNSDALSTNESTGQVKPEDISAVHKPKLPPVSESVSFTALGCRTEYKLTQACYMAAAAKAGIASLDAQREFAALMIARHSAEISIIDKQRISLDDAKVAASINNRGVIFHLEGAETELEKFRENYVAQGGKIHFVKNPTVDLREPGAVGGVTDSTAAAVNTKFRVLLNNKGNPTDATRILAQFAEDQYRGGNLWGQNFTQIGELSAAQGVKPKAIKTTPAGNKVSVEFELTPLDRAKIHENYKTVQTEVNRAVAAYEDFADNNELSSFVRGVVNGALKSVKGTIGLLNLPETMKALWQVIGHPADTFNALSKELNETWEEFKNAPLNKKSEMVGELVGQITVDILIGKGIGEAASILAKTKTGAQILEKAKLLKTATVAKIAEAFSDKAAQAATSRLRQKMFYTFAVTAWADFVIVGTNKVKNGVVSFTEFSKQMVSEFGEAVRPELRKMFDKAVDNVFGNRRDIDLHELLGGHTIEKHVGRTEKWLRERLEREPLLTEASSFYSKEIANRAQLKVVQVYGEELDIWAKGISTKPIKRTIDMDKPAGIVVSRARNATQTSTKVEAIIIKNSTERGWHILSAYPIPK